MKKLILFLVILISSCSRPLYIKDKHFNCNQKEYKIDSDLKELIYKSLKRAVVIEKDIPDYRLLWKKHRIYISNEYQTHKTHFTSEKSWNNSLSYLNSNHVPSKIDNVNFCLKSRKELQKISNRTWEDFLHISFDLIKIEGDTATVKINNTWITSNKHPNKIYLSGGGYITIFKKENNKWKFVKITSRWIS